MGNDRYGNRYGRERGGRFEEGRGRGGYDRGRDGDRGWMERAGEQMRGWFGGDDDDPGRERYAYGDRDRGGWERSDRGPNAYQGGYGRQGRGHEPEVGPQAYGGQGMYEDRDAGRYADTYRGGRNEFSHREGAPYGNTGYGDRNYGNQDAQTSGGRGHVHDPHYHQWRERQMSELDRDYHEYRSENQQRFEEEFHSWRTARQGQRAALRQVREHMEVVGDDGEHVGAVDKVRGDQLILTRNDPAAGGRHHAIPSSWIQGVGEKVMLNRSAEKARGAWRDVEGEGSSRPLGHENDRNADGPHVLERSFSGTYNRDD